MILSALLLLTNLSYPQVDHCQKSTAQESHSYESPYTKDTDYSLLELGQLHDDLYQKASRLPSRLYQDSVTKKWMMGFSESSQNTIMVPDQFVQNIVSHLEQTLNHQYADYLFFPDMGHGHIFLPTEDLQLMKKWNTKKQYEFVFSNRRALVLYHTAEYVAFYKVDTDDENSLLKYRYLNRNIIGDNQKGDIKVQIFSNKLNPFNTVREISGYEQWPMGLIRIQSHHEGCLSLRKNKQQVRFDLKIY